MNRFVLLSLLFVALLLVVVSCGGGAGTTQLDSAKDVQGITEGGFNLVRYDDSGNTTNALNPTLDLAVQPAADTTTVMIAIDDKQPMLGVTLDLNYDASKYTPVDVEFGGLIDTDVELAVTRLRGLVAIGQVSTDGAGMRAGQFATVTFRNEPNRTVSAAGDAADRPINVTYSANGFTAEGFTAVATAGVVDINILGIFTSLSGDGDQNGASNIGDLTPLGAMLGRAVSPTDAVSARADYDGNGLPNISDLTPLGANLGEVTTTIEVLAGDTEATATTVIHTFDWVVDGDVPVSPAVVTAEPNDVWRQFQATIDATATDLADADDDGHIFVTARASNGTGADGPVFTPALDIDLGVGPVSSFLVQGVTIEINGTPVTDGMTLDILQANSAVTLEVTGFTGLHNGVAFTPGTLDETTTPKESEYQAELALIQADFAANITQQLDPTGFAGFQTDKPNVLLDFNTTGTPVNATVFPDDDPGNAAEGNVTFHFARNNTTGVADTTVTLDIQPDPEAPLLSDVRGGAGQDVNGNWIVTNTSPDISGTLTFPAGDPGVFDDTTVDVEIVDLSNDARLPIDFDFVAVPPTAAGTFTLIPSITPGAWDFTVRAPAGLLNDQSLYMVRFFQPAGANGSSVNKPGETVGFLTGGTVPAGFASQVLPRQNLDLTEATPTTPIAIIPADPQILRNPQQDVDVLSGTVTNHYSGAGDVLKSDGDFFSLAVADSVTYPQVVIRVGNDPTVVLAGDLPGVEIQTETNPHRILVDIGGLAPAATTTYAYKAFGAPVIPGDLTSRPVVTDGTFTINVDPIIFSPIAGIDFGINIYDDAGQGDLTLGNEDWSDKLLSVTNIPLNYGDGGLDVDVLFVQFNGGHVVPQSYPGNPFEGFTGNSMEVTLREITGLGPQVDKTLDVRIAGVGAGGLDYIGLAHFTQTDVGAGGLVGGLEYEVELDDAFDGDSPPFSFGTTAGDGITVVF